ncbi:MAG: glycerol-3-phosphate dehydrogenase/oxidase [Candidatus Helarchaeota archaeon]|nr:glycerol-3-phosphate dehydrogenase/oxidase [Candidatus Helarchaeota archaeon]
MAFSADDVMKLDFSDKKRTEIITKLKITDFDMLIIGGGITGAGVARDAIMRGLNVALVEKDDFAEGTSSRSSKLFHGGIRYLRNFEIRLVEEASRERNWERDEAIPHNVRPLHLIIPIYDEIKDPRTGKILPPSKWNLELVEAALKLYDEAGKNQNYGPWETIDDPLKLAEIEPELNHDQLVGIGLYYDTNMDDARITVETIKECGASGKGTALNYLKVIDLVHNEKGIVNGVKVVENDKFSPNILHESFVIKANVVVNCTGVWADEILGNSDDSKIMQPSKGIHFAVKSEDLKIDHGLLLSSIDDGRYFFVIPRENWVLIGTTDTFFDGDLDNPVTLKEEVDYLRNTIELFFPNAKIDDSHILGTYAGLRPLVSEPGKEAGAISRKHIYFEREDGLFSLLGGKYTTFRVMAEDLMRKRVLKSKKVDITRNGTITVSSEKRIAKVPYKVALKRDEFEASVQFKTAQGKLEPEILNHLYIEFGKGAFVIIDKILNTPDLGKPLLEDPEYPPKYFPWVKAEIIYIVKHEIPRHLNDVLCRRTEICWLVHPSKQPKIAEVTADIVGGILGWDKDRKKKEIEFYLSYIKANSYFYNVDL